MPTTTNFGWTTPADTDLVKDGAAAIRTLGNGIDTSLLDLKGGTTGQVLAKASNSDLDFTWATDASGIPATIFDAKGDLIVASAADTAARLAVGTNGHVLTADSTASNGVKWAAVSSGSNWSLLNSGGTNLTAAATITVSGISSANRILIGISNASSANASAMITFRFNSDTGSNYFSFQTDNTATATYSPGSFASDYLADTQIYGATMSNNAASEITGYLYIDGANASGVKAFWGACGGKWGGSGQSGHDQRFFGGVYTGSSTISSVSVLSSSGNFDAGKIWVWTTA